MALGRYHLSMKEEKNVILHLRDFLYHLKTKKKFFTHLTILAFSLMLLFVITKIVKQKPITKRNLSSSYNQLAFLKQYLKKEDAYIASFIDNDFQVDNIYTDILIYNISDSENSLDAYYNNTILNQDLITKISKQLNVDSSFAYDLVSITAYPFGNNALNYKSDYFAKNKNLFITLRGSNLDNLTYLRNLVVEEVKKASAKLSKIYKHQIELVSENILNGPNEYLNNRLNNEIKQYKINKDNYSQLLRQLSANEKLALEKKHISKKKLIKKGLFIFVSPLIIGILYQLYFYLYGKKVNNIYEFEDCFNIETILLSTEISTNLQKRYFNHLLLKKENSEELIINNVLLQKPDTKLILYTGSDIDNDYALKLKASAKKKKIKLVMGNNFKENNDLLNAYHKCDFVLIDENINTNKKTISKQIKDLNAKPTLLLLNI